VSLLLTLAADPVIVTVEPVRVRADDLNREAQAATIHVRRVRRYARLIVRVAAFRRLRLHRLRLRNGRRQCRRWG
jgi:hypothetical protein